MIPGHLDSTVRTLRNWISHQKVLWCAQHLSKGNQIVSWDISSMLVTSNELSLPWCKPLHSWGTGILVLSSPDSFLLYKLPSCTSTERHCLMVASSFLQKTGLPDHWVTAFLGYKYSLATWTEPGCFPGLLGTFCPSASAHSRSLPGCIWFILYSCLEGGTSWPYGKSGKKITRHLDHCIINHTTS